MASNYINKSIKGKAILTNLDIEGELKINTHINNDSSGNYDIGSLENHFKNLYIDDINISNQNISNYIKNQFSGTSPFIVYNNSTGNINLNLTTSSPLNLNNSTGNINLNLQNPFDISTTGNLILKLAKQEILSQDAPAPLDKLFINNEGELDLRNFGEFIKPGKGIVSQSYLSQLGENANNFNGINPLPDIIYIKADIEENDFKFNGNKIALKTLNTVKENGGLNVTLDTLNGTERNQWYVDVDDSTIKIINGKLKTTLETKSGSCISIDPDQNIDIGLDASYFNTVNNQLVLALVNSDTINLERTNNSFSLNTTLSPENGSCVTISTGGNKIDVNFDTSFFQVINNELELNIIDGNGTKMIRSENSFQIDIDIDDDTLVLNNGVLKTSLVANVNSCISIEDNKIDIGIDGSFFQVVNNELELTINDGVATKMIRSENSFKVDLQFDNSTLVLDNTGKLKTSLLPETNGGLSISLQKIGCNVDAKYLRIFNNQITFAVSYENEVADEKQKVADNAAQTAQNSSQLATQAGQIAANTATGVANASAIVTSTALAATALATEAALLGGAIAAANSLAMSASASAALANSLVNGAIIAASALSATVTAIGITVSIHGGRLDSLDSQKDGINNRLDNIESEISNNNFNIETNDVIVNNSIGVGTNSPLEKVDIRGNLRIGGSTQSNYIMFSGTNLDNQNNLGYSYIGERVYEASEKSELLLFKGNDSSEDRIRLLGGEHRFDTYSGALSGAFDTVGATVASNRMTIKNNGNIGINTTSPQAKLHINGNANTNIIFEGTDHVYLQLYPFGYSNGRKAYLGFPGANNKDLDIVNEATGGNIELTNSVGGSIRFMNSTTLAMTITGGNIGIGSSTPQTKLHVEDGSMFIGDVSSIFSTSVPSSPGSSGLANGHRLFFDNSVNSLAGTGMPANKIVLHNNNFTCGFGIELNAVTYHSGNGHRIYCGANNSSTYGSLAMSIFPTQTIVHTNTNGEGLLKIGNSNSGGSAYSLLRVTNNTNDLVMFLNSSTRTNDGGVNTATIRNDAGSLRLQGRVGLNTLFLSENSTNIGINTTSPLYTLDVTGSGDFSTFVTSANLYSTNQTTTNIVSTNISVGNISSSQIDNINSRINILENNGINGNNTFANLNINGTINVFDTTKTFNGGIGTELNAQIINFGINTNKFGTSNTTGHGGFFRVDTRPALPPLQMIYKPFGSTTEVIATVVGSTGNFGIGTLTPSDALHVQSGGLNVSNFGFINTQGARIQWNRSGSLGEMHILNQQGLGVSGHISIGISNQLNVVTEFARFTSTGNFGIGNINPTVKLDVSGTIRSTDFITTNIIASNITVSNINSPQISSLDSRISTLESSVASVSSTGNLGIGTTTPQAKLHVKANAGLNNIFEGTDHVFLQLYPYGYAAGRKAYIGYPGSNSKTFSITNEATGGNIDLTNSVGGSIRFINNTTLAMTISENQTVVTTNTNGEGLLKIGNSNAGSSAYGLLRIGNNTNDLVMFLNSSTRTADGGANTATIRNDAGALRLQGRGGFNTLFLADNSSNVGINTLTPTANLDVRGNARVLGDNTPTSLLISNTVVATDYVEMGLANGPGQYSFQATAGDGIIRANKKLILQSGLSSNLTIGTNGNIGIGQEPDFSKVSIKKTGGEFCLSLQGGGDTGSAGLFIATHSSKNLIAFRANLPNGNPGSFTGAIFSDGSSTTYSTVSDYRLKENVVPLSNALGKLEGLPFYEYNFIGNTNVMQGVMAHELEKISPQCVRGIKDGEDYQTVDYSKMTPLLGSAIQELNKTVKELKARIVMLENK